MSIEKSIHETPSNYYLIVNVSFKLLIVSMSLPPKLPKHVNISHNDKNTLHKIIKIKKKN
jgi:hypothetical protein